MHVVIRINASSSQRKGKCAITEIMGSGDQDDGIKVELAYDVSPPLCTKGGSKA